MKNFKKIITLMLLYFMAFSAIPSTVATKAVQAATSLIKVEANTKYYMSGIVQYKNKTFILGGDFQETNRPVKLSVKEGNNTSVIATEAELGEWPFFIAGQTSNKIYFNNFENIYSVDKNTNKFEKQTKAEALKTFNTANKINYADLFIETYFFNNEGLSWIVGYNEGDKVLIHKDGVLKSPVNNIRFFKSAIDKSNNLYGFDYDTNKLVKISPNGSETRYTIPKQNETSSGNVIQIVVDNNDRLYILDNNDRLSIFKISNGALQQLKTSDNIDNIYTQSSNKLVSYMKKDGENSIIGFIDNTLNFKDKYLTTYPYLQVSAYDENNLAIERGDYYGIITGSKTPAPTPNLKGWVQQNGKWYYYENGNKKTGWLNNAGKWYFLNKAGDMATGWVSSGGKWYFMNPSGDMATGWISNGGKWYFMNPSGDMATGWVSSGGKWYYMNKSGVMVTGWINVSGKWYYMYDNGAMAVNTTIGGYKIGKDGVWIP